MSKEFKTRKYRKTLENYKRKRDFKSLSEKRRLRIGIWNYSEKDIKEFIKIVEDIIKDFVPIPEKMRRLKKAVGPKLITKS